MLRLTDEHTKKTPNTHGETHKKNTQRGLPGKSKTVALSFVVPSFSRNSVVDISPSPLSAQTRGLRSAESEDKTTTNFNQSQCAMPMRQWEMHRLRAAKLQNGAYGTWWHRNRAEGCIEVWIAVATTWLNVLRGLASAGWHLRLYAVATSWLGVANARKIQESQPPRRIRAQNSATRLICACPHGFPCVPTDSPCPRIPLPLVSPRF